MPPNQRQRLLHPPSNNKHNPPQNPHQPIIPIFQIPNQPLHNLHPTLHIPQQNPRQRPHGDQLGRGLVFDVGQHGVGLAEREARAQLEDARREGVGRG